jgi:four helix bundle protein
MVTTTTRQSRDLRSRLFDFACAIVSLAMAMRTRSPVAVVLSEQILRSGTSAGANYEEASDGSSRRDSRAKIRIALREMKETRYRLRLLDASGILTPDERALIAESDELVRILATIVTRLAD